MSTGTAIQVSQLISPQHEPVRFTEQIRDEYARHHSDIFRHQAPPIDESSDVLNAMTYSDSSDQRENAGILASYEILADHLCQQYETMVSHGVSFIEHDSNEEPYRCSADMLEDLENKTLVYLPTSKTNTIEDDHPMVRATPLKNSQGTSMMLNDVFRCVHDSIAHSAGYDFSFRGEKGAWLVHRELLPRAAHLALWNETRGQNAWTNAGEHIRILDGNGFYRLPRKEDKEWVPMRDRPFPQQKCVLAPSWMI